MTAELKVNNNQSKQTGHSPTTLPPTTTADTSNNNNSVIDPLINTNHRTNIQSIIIPSPSIWSTPINLITTTSISTACPPLTYLKKKPTNSTWTQTSSNRWILTKTAAYRTSTNGNSQPDSFKNNSNSTNKKINSSKKNFTVAIPMIKP